MTNLKPCPFCGGETTLCSVVSMQHEICYVVKCDDLNCIMCAGGTLRKTISQAIEAWNRRAGEEVLTMNEYINRKRARFEAEHYFKGLDNIQEDLDMLFCMLPAEDVAPVRHGRWVTQDETRTKFMCSLCESKNYGGHEKFCPNCGARMDGGDKNG